MDRRSSHSGVNTFFFGILVGVALTLLITTKKGRKILKTLVEEGTDRISRWEEMLKELEESAVEEPIDEDEAEEEEEEEQEYVQPTERESVLEESPVPVQTFEKIEKVVEVKEEKKPEEKKKEDVKEAKTESKPKSSSRRFFKGIRKK